MRVEAPLDVRVEVTITKIRKDLPDNLPPDQIEKWKQQARGEIMQRFLNGFGDALVTMSGLAVVGEMDFGGVVFKIGTKK